MSVVGLSPQIDSCKYLLLHSISETDEDHLTIVVREGRTLSEEASKALVDQPFPGARLIHADETSRTFEIVWTNYVAYVVRNESYAVETSGDCLGSGRLLRVFETSAFLQYVAVATFASADYPGPLTHIEVACQSHIIDVVSDRQPKISLLSGAPPLRNVSDDDLKDRR